MTNHQFNFNGWILFAISAIGFCILSIGPFWAMDGSVCFLIACTMFVVPFFRNAP